MGFYKQRELYLEGLAEAHPLVRHNQQVSSDDTRPRQSFFRINDEEELISACKNWLHTPLIVQFSLGGSEINKDGSYRQLNENTWLVLTSLILNPENPLKAPAITDAYDTTFDIVQYLKTSVRSDVEENEGCGIFKNIVSGSFKWEQYGPVADRLYGWILTFRDETNPG